MHKFVSHNGKVCQLSEAHIPAASSAALYGRGIFTTIAIYNGKPFLWHLHERRLRHHSSRIGLDYGKVSFPDLQNSLLGLIALNKIDNGRARITLFDAGSSKIWKFSEEAKTETFIVTGENRNAPEGKLDLTVSPFRVNTASPLVGVKSCNYLEKLIALKAALADEYHEAVCLNERGEVVSAIMANIFWIKDNQIYLPSVRTGALEGTTREFVIVLAEKNGLEMVEALTGIEHLEEADEVFLTSAALGVRSVHSFKAKIYQSNFTRKLQKDFLDFTNQ